MSPQLFNLFMDEVPIILGSSKEGAGDQYAGAKCLDDDSIAACA